VTPIKRRRGTPRASRPSPPALARSPIAPRARWRRVCAGAASALLFACAYGDPGSNAKDGAAPSGRAVYDRDCAICHGSDGRGDGPAAPRLAVAARDFTTGRYKFRSTGSGQPPTDDDLRRSIVRGLRGTAMVPQNHLSDAEVDAVVAYIKAFSPVFAATPAPHPLAMPRRPDGVPDLARGKHIYHEAGCHGCHGETGAGDGVVAKDLSQAPANLTRRPLKGGSDAADILRAVVTGLDGTPMPSYHLLYDDGDMWALAYYVESLGGPEVMTDEEKLGWEIERRTPPAAR
jgi:mono/diheme cytochrome c family protein